jgi:hypothetical protein
MPSVAKKIPIIKFCKISVLRNFFVKLSKADKVGYFFFVYLILRDDWILEPESCRGVPRYDQLTT